jgi:tRNA nucleotidyltransferase (CCA-adding enzyme)
MKPSRRDAVPASAPILRTDQFIQSLGVEAYRVGGSVRDEILGRKPKDADYVVRGVTLDELGAVLRQASMEGSAFVPRKIKDRAGRHLGWRAKGVEIVLPRKEVSTGPGRHDFDIVLDPWLSLEEDAKRRDFTFNALYRIVAKQPDENVLITDPLNGHDDLMHKTVRVTHADSFRDDPLRILRALRFVSVLGYDIEPQTLALMHVHADAVDGLSASGGVSGTVFEEMSTLLMGDDVRKALRIARDTGVLARLFPELEPAIGFDQESKWHDMTVDEHIFAALDAAAQVDAPLHVRWSLLFHDSGKPESAWRGEKDGRLHYYPSKGEVWAEIGGVRQTEDHAVIGARLWRKAAERINVSSKLREQVATLIENHMLSLDKPKKAKVRKWRVKFGDDTLRDLVLHRACDCSGKVDRGATWKDNMAVLGKIMALQKDAIDNNVPSTAQELDISGHDLMELGLKGRQIGKAQHQLLHEVITEQTPNDREHLLSSAARLGR